MKLAKFCKCIDCTDCEHYADCMECKIETERAKGKLTFGRLKKSRFIIYNSLQD